jgi:hypothetical protein
MLVVGFVSHVASGRYFDVDYTPRRIRSRAGNGLKVMAQ